MKKTLIAIALTLTTATAFAAMDHSAGDQSNMDQSGMDHSMMKSGEMDHSKMDHSMMTSGKMDHSKMMNMDGMMDMEGMSEVGMPAKGAKPDKVVHVLLSDDMKITFKNKVDIEPNDVVQFVVMNTGKIDHEFSIGSASEQLEHREMMKNMGNHAHDSGSTVTVEPGKAKQLLWHFHGDNNVEFACNIPGHAEAGMVKALTL
ncbi:cupredoxin family protein [Vibrio cyclitrophicus 1F53]|uniref:Copper-binding protein n=3 Tax=Vibrio cyclitrophicus TaxID=47951 RepID=A0A7Z1MM31_9VIBR|nr:MULTISPECIES: cupredoxin family protein [Vibrio]MCF7484609.1 copper-binding protein [Vibrio sp. A2-1]OED65188.1 copper-binding protein [Vibrio cyclitrophicus ZF99]OEE14560.1 copper-binding protein [Vibrio cyclitrophicus ZF205]OEF34676.1 copper-binding protein [Vibrio cyclitrophicus 1F53]OEF62816.1 copper-binding protein [Vibrio cyclitrophicus 1F175]